MKLKSVNFIKTKRISTIYGKWENLYYGIMYIGRLRIRTFQLLVFRMVIFIGVVRLFVSISVVNVAMKDIMMGIISDIMNVLSAIPNMR